MTMDMENREGERDSLHLGEDHKNKGSLGTTDGNRAQCLW